MPVARGAPYDTEGTAQLMFTGIVEERGEVVAVRDLGDSARLSVHAPRVTEDARLGDSIAVDGCCLTVVDVDGDTFAADVMRATLTRTTLGGTQAGAAVNLERAVPALGRLGGHLVQGHVDGTGIIRAREPSAHWDLVTVEVAARLVRYLAPQGSVALDGVSLTVVDVDDGPDHPTFTVSLIPATLAATTLGQRMPGASLNVEVDIIAKYVERLLVRPHAEVRA